MTWRRAAKDRAQWLVAAEAQGMVLEALPASCMTSPPLPSCSTPLPGPSSLLFLLEPESAPQLLRGAGSLSSPGRQLPMPCPTQGPVAVSRGTEPCCAQQKLFLSAL